MPVYPSRDNRHTRSWQNFLCAAPAPTGATPVLNGYTRLPAHAREDREAIAATHPPPLTDPFTKRDGPMTGHQPPRTPKRTPLRQRTTAVHEVLLMLALLTTMGGRRAAPASQPAHMAAAPPTPADAARQNAQQSPLSCAPADEANSALSTTCAHPAGHLPEETALRAPCAAHRAATVEIMTPALAPKATLCYASCICLCHSPIMSPIIAKNKPAETCTCYLWTTSHWLCHASTEPMSALHRTPQSQEQDESPLKLMTADRRRAAADAAPLPRIQTTYCDTTQRPTPKTIHPRAHRAQRPAGGVQVFRGSPSFVKRSMGGARERYRRPES